QVFVVARFLELAVWLASDVVKQYPAQLLGRCAAPLRDLSGSQVEQLLNEAALVRLQRKATDLQARARQAGWEQALWEGMLRALGYKHNLWPMQCLAELRPRLASGENLSVFQLQARLLAVGGLLPPELTRNKAS